MTIKEKALLLLKLRVWARMRINRYPSYNLSHSQFGEDMVLRFLASGIERGVYVDVGAHHPILISNTYHFYCQGWRGLNIDAMPGSMDRFRLLRPEDINVETCIGPVSGQVMDYYIFEQSAFNTINACSAEETIRTGAASLIERRSLKTVTIGECLDEHLKGKHINLLNIDVEGLDEAILRSDLWERDTPDILVFEKAGQSLEEILQSPLMRYLSSLGYHCVAKCGPSVIMRLGAGEGLFR